jgi:hypothetical protein
MNPVCVSNLVRGVCDENKNNVTIQLSFAFVGKVCLHT